MKLPLYHLGCGLTPVGELTVAEATELARIILEDEAVRVCKPKNSRDGEALYVGQHISYVKLPKYLRGSDRTERVYAAVKLFMRALLLQTTACKEVAKILGPKLGNSRRGRPVKDSRCRPQRKDEIVRSIYNSFEKRNPWPPPEESAAFVDSRAEFWFGYAMTIRATRKGSRESSPSGWKPAPCAQFLSPDGGVQIVPFPTESLPE